MTAKEELREIYYKDKEIIRLYEQIEETEARLQKCTSVLSDMPQAKGGSNDRMTDGVSKLIELKQKLNKKVDKACGYRLDCMEKIDRIQDGRLRTILEERYLNGRRFEEISLIVNYDYYNTIKLHGKALQEYEKQSHQEIPTN